MNRSKADRTSHLPSPKYPTSQMVSNLDPIRRERTKLYWYTVVPQKLLCYDTLCSIFHHIIGLLLAFIAMIRHWTTFVWCLQFRDICPKLFSYRDQEKTFGFLGDVRAYDMKIGWQPDIVIQQCFPNPKNYFPKIITSKLIDTSRITTFCESADKAFLIFDFYIFGLAMIIWCFKEGYC